MMRTNRHLSAGLTMVATLAIVLTASWLLAGGANAGTAGTSRTTVAAAGSNSSTTMKDQSYGSNTSTSTDTNKKMSSKRSRLDGETFVGQIGSEGNTNGEKDTITFRHGKFRSSANDAEGFKAARYTVTTDENGALSFTAVCMSKTKGKMEWKGTVKDGVLDATATLVQKDQQPVTMWAKANEEMRTSHHSKKQM